MTGKWVDGEKGKRLANWLAGECKGEEITDTAPYQMAD